MTRTSKALAWMLWAASLLLCPISMMILAAIYGQPPSPESFHKPLPWAWHVIQILFVCQLGLSLAAAAASCWLTPDWQKRLLALLAVILMLGVSFLAELGASMGVSGRYL